MNRLRRATKLVIASAALAVGGLAFAAPAAHAYTPRPHCCLIDSSPPQIHLNEAFCSEFWVYGSGFNPGAWVKVTLTENGADYQTQYVQADTSGNIPAPGMSVMFTDPTPNVGLVQAYADDLGGGHIRAWSNQAYC
jgi:hypothetical protein